MLKYIVCPVTVSFVQNFMLVADLVLGAILNIDMDTGTVSFVPGAVSRTPVAVALDDVQNRIYWSDDTWNQILVLPITGKQEQMEVFFQLESGIQVD